MLLAATEFVAMAACAYVGITLTQPELVQSGEQGDAIFQYAVIFSSVMLLSTFAMGVYEAGLTESFSLMAVRSVVSFCLLGSVVMVILNYIFPNESMMQGALFW